MTKKDKGIPKIRDINISDFSPSYNNINKIDYSGFMSHWRPVINNNKNNIIYKKWQFCFITKDRITDAENSKGHSFNVFYKSIGDLFWVKCYWDGIDKERHKTYTTNVKDKATAEKYCATIMREFKAFSNNEDIYISLSSVDKTCHKLSMT